MDTLQKLADELARDAIKYIDATGDEDIVEDLVKILGETSQTAEEAFKTAVRVRRANNKARELLKRRVEEFAEKLKQAKLQKQQEEAKAAQANKTDR